MTGLEKIINQIKLDADSTCNSIKAKSDSACDKIMSKAMSDADAIIKDGEIKAEAKYNDIINRAQSTANLESRKIMLTTKQEVINTMISSALSNLKALSVDEYFAVILKMVAKYSDTIDGSVAFCKADLDRLPKNFEAKINSVSNGKLTVLSEPVSIDSGFVLIYGGVEVNCSFESIFADNSEKMSDTVSRLLFA